MTDERERRFSRFLVRVAVLLGILIAIPVLYTVVVALLSGDAPQSMRTDPSFARIQGKPVYNLHDYDEDGRVDCVKQVPAFGPFARGFTATPRHRRCRGTRIAPMSPGMRELLDELLRTKIRLEAQLGSALDLDGDGVADCVTYGGTRYQAPGHDCPDPLPDARALDAASRADATRILELERRLRQELDSGRS